MPSKHQVKSASYSSPQSFGPRDRHVARKPYAFDWGAAFRKMPLPPVSPPEQAGLSTIFGSSLSMMGGGRPVYPAGVVPGSESYERSMSHLGTDLSRIPIDLDPYVKSTNRIIGTVMSPSLAMVKSRLHGGRYRAHGSQNPAGGSPRFASERRYGGLCLVASRHARSGHWGNKSNPFGFSGSPRSCNRLGPERRSGHVEQHRQACESIGRGPCRPCST